MGWGHLMPNCGFPCCLLSSLTRHHAKPHPAPCPPALYCPCIAAGGVVEYKYVLLDHSGQLALAWQQGNNSVLAVRSTEDVVEVFDTW